MSGYTAPREHDAPPLTTESHCGKPVMCSQPFGHKGACWSPHHEERIRALERQVDILRRGIGLIMASAKPGVEWVDESFERIAKEENDAQTHRG